MTAERFRHVREVFELAVQLPAESRDRYIWNAGQQDSELLIEVQRMVEAAQCSDCPIDRPAVDLAAEDARPGPPATRPLPAQISHYRVSRVLGHGGMGIVYCAEDLMLGREVALKLLLDEITREGSAIGRFKREARAAAAINHPNICTVYEIGEHEGSPYIAMELLHGETLADRIHGEPTPLATLLNWAIQITDALEAAHERGIIHRDLKPANLFITERGQPKILDFGVAKLRLKGPNRESSVPGRTLTAIETELGHPIGTPAYMSPEQVRGEDLDARTDLFSFGVVLYEMAAGKRPFRGSNALEDMASVLRDTPESPIHVNRELPRKLQEIITKALEKNREMRYRSAADLLVDLKGLRSDLESRGPIPNAVTRLTRHRTSIAICIAILLSGLAFFASSPGRTFILREFFWPLPFYLHSHPWADDFSHGLSYWTFPDGAWQVQILPRSGVAPPRSAVVVKSSNIGVPATIGPDTALYDFEFDLRARFVAGDRISWAFRVQNDRKRAYVFEIQKRLNGIELRGYIYPDRKLIPGSVVDQTITGCCNPDSELTIHSVAQEDRFTFWIKLEAGIADDNTESDAGKSFKLPTIDVGAPRYLFGNIGLLETDSAGAMLVEYVQVSEVRHHDS